MTSNPTTDAAMMERAREFDLGRLPSNFRRNVLVTDGGCWLWTGPLNRKGYGRFSVPDIAKGRSKATAAHRVAHVALVGPTTDGLCLDHLKIMANGWRRCRECMRIRDRMRKASIRQLKSPTRSAQ